MAEPIDQEIEAIKVVLGALEPLPSVIRENVLAYVIKRLRIAVAPPQQTEIVGMSEQRVEATRGAAHERAEKQAEPAHIKELKENKKPRSASEMAAVVAYYLANLAPQKKDRVRTRDIETYFKIAEFPLPEKPQFTLPNAKAAGYLDAVGNGEYKLNAVGHNLVVHSLPRGAEGKPVSRRRPAKKLRRPAKKRQ